jgi:hypothetical protein
MTRFPLRLWAALAKGRIFRRRSPGEANCSPILRLDAEELLHRAAQQPVSHETVREILHARKPIVWIGGSEPLVHPGIAHLTRLIAQSGHFLFLDTDGVLLRQRIHEFQPTSRFYFSIRFHGCEAEHDRRAGRAGAFRAAIEGIRVARLSGFLLCGHTVLQAESDAAGLTRLWSELRGCDLDGMLISSGAVAASRASGVARVVLEARRRLLRPGWEAFSRLVDSAGPAGFSRQVVLPVPEPMAASQASEAEREERVQA